jgi:hypothetical protein
MKFDVTKFKKIKSDEKQSVLEHPDGHTIVIEHDKLRPEIKKVLDKIPLQHFAEGGMVQETRDPAALKFTEKKGFTDIPEENLKNQAEQIAKPHQYDKYFKEAAAIAGIDPFVLKSLAINESGLIPGYEKKSRSRGVGRPPAQGLMQLTSGALKDAENEGYKVKNVFDPKENILGSGYYLKAIKKQLQSNAPDLYREGVPTDDVIGAYHMGAKDWINATYKGKKITPERQFEYTQHMPKAMGAYYYGMANKMFNKPFGEDLNRSPNDLPAGPGINAQVPFSPEYSKQLQQEKLQKEIIPPFTPEYSQQIKGQTYPAQEPIQVKQPERGFGDLYKESLKSTFVEPIKEMMIPGYSEQKTRETIVPFTREYSRVLKEQQQEQQPESSFSAIQPGITQPEAQVEIPQFQQTLTPTQLPTQPGKLSYEQEMAKAHGAKPEQIPGIGQAQREVYDPMGYKWLQEQLATGYGLQREAIQNQMKVYTDTASEINKRIKEQNDEYQALLTRKNDYLNAYQKESKKALDMLSQQSIDPNRWIHSNVSTVPQKIVTAIGLLISGVGAGLTGQENMASKWINDQITRDIEAQQKTFDQGNNILRAYTDYFKNINDGLDMTTAVMKSYYANLIQQELNKQQGALKSNEALGLIAQLNNDAAIKFQELAQRAAMQDYFLKTMQQGAGGKPEAQIRAYQMIGMITPEQSQRMYKDVQEYTSNLSRIGQLEKAYNELMDLSYLGSKATAPIQTKNKISALKAEILGPLSRALAGKFSEFEVTNLEGMLPLLTDNAKTLEDKSKLFRSTIASVLNLPGFVPNYPELSAYGVNLPKYVPQPIVRKKPTGYQKTEQELPSGFEKAR